MKYKLEYLPVAQQDMVEIITYISHDLSNPTAAEKLADEMIAAAEGIREFPYSNEVHISIRPLKHEYRKIIVDNYFMFYWVDEAKHLIIIARVIYMRRDLGRALT